MQSTRFKVLTDMDKNRYKQQFYDDLKKIAAMVKTRIEVFPDIADHIDFFEQVPEYDISMYTHKK